MRTLRTERLRLTPVTVHNANALWHVLQQPDLRAYQDLPNVGASAFTSMVAKRPSQLAPGAFGRFEWLVYLHRTRRPIGWVSLRVSERDPNLGEIGYSIIREFRGQGIATEATRALIDEAFEQARLEQLRAYCLPANRASRKVLANVGFEQEGVLPHGASINGHPVDVLGYGMPLARWRQSENSIEISASA